MPLTLLAVLVIGGILGVILLVHSFGWTGGTGFADEAEARRIFAHDYADRRIDHVILSDDSRAAIMTTDHGAGIVIRFGRGSLTRHLLQGDLQRLVETPNGLQIHLRDDSAPRLKFAFADTGARGRAAAILKPLSEA